MNRRRLLFTGAAVGATALAGGLFYVARPKDHAHLALDPLLDKLAGLRADGIETASAWDVARTLNHLAQGVEFSMTGYPELRSGLFRHTVGRTAFNVFQTRGAMRHNTEEAIPGEVVESLDPEVAKSRLIDSLMAFRDHEPELEPHFAYGALTKDAYTKAHVMHVHDHLVEFRVEQG